MRPLALVAAAVKKPVFGADHARSLPGVAGLHLISFRREAGIARLCERLGIPTRRERETSGYRRSVAV